MKEALSLREIENLLQRIDRHPNSSLRKFKKLLIAMKRELNKGEK